VTYHRALGKTGFHEASQPGIGYLEVIFPEQSTSSQQSPQLKFVQRGY
jgi:hypothetical protein